MLEAIFVIFVIVDVMLLGAVAAEAAKGNETGDSDGTGGC